MQVTHGASIYAMVFRFQNRPAKKRFLKNILRFRLAHALIRLPRFRYPAEAEKSNVPILQSVTSGKTRKDIAPVDCFPALPAAIIVTFSSLIEWIHDSNVLIDSILLRKNFHVLR